MKAIRQVHDASALNYDALRRIWRDRLLDFELKTAISTLIMESG